MIELYDPFAPSEMNCEGSLFGRAQNLRCIEKHRMGATLADD